MLPREKCGHGHERIETESVRHVSRTKRKNRGVAAAGALQRTTEKEAEYCRVLRSHKRNAFSSNATTQALCLGPLLPACKVFDLFRRECVDRQSHGDQLKTSDILVDLRRKRDHFVFEYSFVF